MASKRRRGQMVEVIDGVNKGKSALMYYDEQTEETKKAGKILVHLIDLESMIKESGKPILIEPGKLKRTGFFD